MKRYVIKCNKSTRSGYHKIRIMAGRATLDLDFDEDEIIDTWLDHCELELEDLVDRNGNPVDRDEIGLVVDSIDGAFGGGYTMDYHLTCPGEKPIHGFTVLVQDEYGDLVRDTYGGGDEWPNWEDFGWDYVD